LPEFNDLQLFFFPKSQLKEEAPNLQGEKWDCQLEYQEIF